MKSIISIALLLFFNTSYAQINAPASACVNTSVNFTSPVAAASYSWIFDTVNIVQAPGTYTTSSVSGMFGGCYATMNNDNGTWYSFISQDASNEILRLNYGTNPNGTFTASSLGTSFGSAYQMEGIDIVKDDASGNWYGFGVNGTALIRLSFGNSLGNTPTSSIMTFPSDFAWPHQVSVDKYGSEWVGFTANRSGAMTRLDFGTNIASTPTATNLPSASIVNPCNYAIYKEGSDWYMLVNNLINATIARVNFGSSIKNNSPVVTSLGNPSSLLNLPRSISIMSDCNQLVAYVQNENGNYTRLDFNGSIANAPTATSLGNAGPGSQNSFTPYSYNGAEHMIMVTFTNSDIYRRPVLTLPAPNQIVYNNSSVNHTFTSPGTYKVTLYCDQGTADGPASFCSSIIITSGGHILRDTGICQGDSVLLDVSGAGGTGYSWSTGATTSSIYVKTAGKYTVNITGSACMTKDSATIALSPKPNVDLGADSTYCGSSTVLSNKLTLPPGTTYLWSNNATSPSIIAGAAGDYWLRATSNGCANTDTVNIGFMPSPTANAGKDTAICPNSLIQLNGTGSTGATTYAWFPTDSMDNPSSPTPKVTVTGGTKYRLIVTNNVGCSDTDFATISFLGNAFNVFPKDPAICRGESLQLYATGGHTFVWSNKESLSNANVNNPTARPDTTTTYFVSITEGSCNYTAKLPITVIVKPTPDVIASITHEIDCRNAYAQLLATGASSYYWTPSKGLNDAGIDAPIARPTENTRYRVTAKNAEGCTDTMSVMVDVAKLNNTILAPNAFTPNGDGRNDCFNILVPFAVKSYEFAIFNRWGNRVYQSSNPNDCWNGTYNGRQQDLGTYHYYYKLNSDICGEVQGEGSVHIVR